MNMLCTLPAIMTHALVAPVMCAVCALLSATKSTASVRLALAKISQVTDPVEFSHAMNAARRAEKRRVRGFVRLLVRGRCGEGLKCGRGSAS